MSERAIERVKCLKDMLSKSLDLGEESDLRDAVDLIWSVGPRRWGPNLLIRRFPSEKICSIWEKRSILKGEISDFESR